MIKHYRPIPGTAHEVNIDLQERIAGAIILHESLSRLQDAPTVIARSLRPVTRVMLPHSYTT